MEVRITYCTLDDFRTTKRIIQDSKFKIQDSRFFGLLLAAEAFFDHRSFSEGDGEGAQWYSFCKKHYDQGNLNCHR
jgi:hypothetical protein